ncbi:MAG: recombination protein RecR [Candidatus Omnitrophica bacterium CG1_02_44_16]|nr:MAG: recombination protein RecR [Candidatus Omnitrophica bacterium CG1_02_44_16]PIY81977.1 MAG: recombination protein RecR [Candidatus Omnitrophica bacterium CG_4_10_14_0_8_um_filter_44_12]PIZ84106.1 MAG: recombination protein RecR [Candidatus Omnitrophica bacterium CG_4_10_14_0_2_um_filter_44_9]
MAGYSLGTIEKLIEELMKLPGIGRRSAQRIVFHILESGKEEAGALSDAIRNVKEQVRFCSVCNNFSETEVCGICSDAKRDNKIVCVVESPKDVENIERSGTFHGAYHVLLGAISPLEGRGPHDLKVNGLIDRIKSGIISEVVIATDSDTEGEATAIFLTKLIRPLGVKVMRIGIGLPVGSNLEYADPATLARAIEGRREM